LAAIWPVTRRGRAWRSTTLAASHSPPAFKWRGPKAVVNLSPCLGRTGLIWTLATDGRACTIQLPGAWVRPQSRPRAVAKHLRCGQRATCNPPPASGMIGEKSILVLGESCWCTRELGEREHLLQLAGAGVSQRTKPESAAPSLLRR
jgi:hypothetical protein